MKSKIRSLLILLLITTLFKGVVWAALTPIWQAPDEQAHFAQVQYYAELKRGIQPGNNLSFEVYESERLLGTLRDELGNNKFTYHPEYRIEYSQTLEGIHENYLKNLPQSARTKMVKKEAARYPPLFYLISSLGYYFGYPYSLFVRLSLTRMISVVMAVGTVYTSFLLAKSVFPKDKLMAISVAAAVSFQPMFSFLSSGVNNDNLLILLATILLWLMVDAIAKGLSIGKTIALGAVLGLGILTKQLIYPFAALPLIVVLFSALKDKNKRKSAIKNLVIFALALLFFGGIVFVKRWMQTGQVPGWPTVTADNPMASLSFGQYLKDKIGLLYRETLPWYWGVFKWLGVVLPLNVLRGVKILMALSLAGILRHLIKRISQKKATTQDWQLLFLGFSSIWFVFWLLFWDYSLVRSIGFSHGLQGRNFFPNLAAHMTLLIFGLRRLSKTYGSQVVKLAALAFTILNFIALETMAGSYYRLSPIKTLIIQASQYQPWFFKNGMLVLWFVIYLTLFANFINSFISYKKEEK